MYIVDNESEDRSVRKYLSEWCDISKQMDIAVGYWEIGGNLILDGDWQKLDKIRIILGNEVTKRTKDVIEQAVQSILSRMKDSIDTEQEKDEFLLGVPAILDALKTRKIECRVYNRSKFHAKTYITYFRDDYKAQFPTAMDVPAGYALVGSSNFTKAGLTQNIELNVQLKDDVEELQEWFEKYWKEGEDITEAILDVIEQYCKEYSPYDVYLRSMYEYFKTHEETVSEWEQNESVMYPILSQYQRDGYKSLVTIADRYSGAFLCDGVGLGKTFVGLMLIERFVKKEGKRVVLMVPASARVAVWETTIKKYMPEILSGFHSFIIVNHTDLTAANKQETLDLIKAYAQVVIIDEAHNFRNQGSNRYRKLLDMMNQGPQKQMYMLTATPINNSFHDLRHLIELFTRGDDAYFSAAPLGINSIMGHFKRMEDTLIRRDGTGISDGLDVSDDIFRNDRLVQTLVVQRSRAFVKRSLTAAEGDKVKFSERQDPIVANYSLSFYGKLINDFVRSFDRVDRNGRRHPILTLPVYYPYSDPYYIGDPEKLSAMDTQRQFQIVALIRLLLLKRFESSIEAFQETCIRIFVRLRKFVLDYADYGNRNYIERRLDMFSETVENVEKYISDMAQGSIEDLEDDLPEYIWVEDETLDVKDFDIRTMIEDTLLDIEVLARFLDDINEIDLRNDDKIRELKRILTEDEHTKGKKIIIFTEYRSTAQYIFRELKAAGFSNIFELDGQTKGNRHEIIQRFSPYYNGKTSDTIKDEIRILISTDVLAEGLNLQDASCLINYELHWNPVKLMQRIGRIDRRLDASIEEQIRIDHPDMAADRPKAWFWNFLPPDELERLLSLYQTVAQKTLRISKTLGIEGKKLLTPEDDYDALKDLNSSYEGTPSADEEMALAYQELMKVNPDYETLLQIMPLKIFSGRLASTRKGLFFCYELPVQDANGEWVDGIGLNRWYLLDSSDGSVSDATYEIWKAILCKPEEPRILQIDQKEFSDKRKLVEKYIKQTYLRSVMAPIGVKPRLITWMELI